jgi:poly-gamma-glutamate capsule biosynthesis protein CapA/YwtB (metallophosphatase superfamily)
MAAEHRGCGLLNKRVGRRLYGALRMWSVMLLAVHLNAQAVKGEQRYEAESGDITMALTGDSLINRPIMSFQEERFLKLRDLLLSADVRFTNGETLFHNYEDPPTAVTGVWERSDPGIIKDLQWLGINLMSTANNHAYDYGENGVLTNLRYVTESGMIYAGTGRNYAEAVAPAYLETPKGRVALIAATTSGSFSSRAGEQSRDMQGRPGVNFIRWMYEWQVDKERFVALRQIAQQFKWDQSGDAMRSYLVDKKAPGDVVYLSDRNLGMPASSKSIQFLDIPPARYILGDSFERHSVLHRSDLERNVQSVNDAHRMADWVVYSVHSHEGGASNDLPSDHVQALAHAVIDAGGDVFVGHGPNITRGIEIYKGKPIFYSLGNLFRETQTSLLVPQEARPFYGLPSDSSPADYYDDKQNEDGGGAAAEAERQRMQCVIAITTFKNKKLETITLYPIDLGADLPRSEEGRPVLAVGQKAHEILERIQKQSASFHTKIEIVGDVGIVQIQ